jgi:hypothetical protein
MAQQLPCRATDPAAGHYLFWRVVLEVLLAERATAIERLAHKASIGSASRTLNGTAK